MKTKRYKGKMRKSGFIALFLVIGAMVMLTEGSLGASSAALGFDDSVVRREYRMIAAENADSCVSVALLAFAHDYFYAAQNQSVPDFSCTIVSAERNGQNISITASGDDGGITETIARTSLDTGSSIILVQ